MRSFRGNSAISFTSAPFAELATRLPEKARIALLTDEKLAKIYASELQRLQKTHRWEMISFAATERTKSLRTVEKLADVLQEKKFGRKDTVLIALGGGIVGDIVGFLASIYLRGVQYFQVPTTLLAMVDSSIGGKTGVNTRYGKNMLGAFYDPETVIISPFFLRSLPEKEISNGLAEMVKHAVLDNYDHLRLLEKNLPRIFARDEKILLMLIKKSIQVKLRHVDADPQEKKAVRSFLNFGHTIGHALEKASLYRTPHGEAVSIGMVMESDIAQRYCGFKGKKDLMRVLQKCRLPVKLPQGIKKSDLKKFMLQDKKNEKTQVVFALPQSFGEMTLVQNVRS